MKVELKFEGLARVQRQLAGLTGEQAKQSFAKAINDTAFYLRRQMQAEMRAVFDRPTAYVLRSVQVKQATPQKLEATVLPTYFGGKGVDPQQILDAQSDGGKRRDKRSEVALRRIGILPNGFQTAIPETPFPGSDDGNGNLKGSFLVQLLSYFQALGEQGYKANMTAKRKRNLETKGTKTMSARRYFVSYGALRSDKTGHLAPGIWASTGTHGVLVRPVLMFVKAGTYRSRLNLERLARKAGANAYLARRLRYRIRQAAGV